MMIELFRETERQLLRFLHGRQTRTKLKEIHANIIRHNLHQSNLLLSHFVSVCGLSDKMDYARQLFSQIENPNILLFNSMIKGYSVSGPSEESLHLFPLMKDRGIWPDQYTLVPLLKSCSNLSSLKFGRGIHAQIINVGFDSHTCIQIGLVEFYSCCKRIDEARQVFDLMPNRNVVVWNMMICGFCKIGNVDMGIKFFREMSERSIVSWNSMISGLSQSGRDIEALELFREMWDAGIEPDDATIVIVLPVCAHLGALDVGNLLHSYADSKGFLRKIVLVANSLVDFYCKSGDLETAQRIFKEIPRKSVVSWNVMISGLALNGKGELGIELYEKMKKKGVNPNAATFVGVLACCTHAGLVDMGRALFDSMAAEHKIEPELQHYGCMVDLLGRSGHIREAQELIQSMPMKPNAAILGAWLSACRIHGDLELAEFASKELIRLEPWNSGNYVLLSNIYAELGKWDDVEKVRVLMNDNKVLKMQGFSEIK